MNASDAGSPPRQSTATVVVTLIDDVDRLPPTWLDSALGIPIYETIIEIFEDHTGVVTSLEADVNNDDQINYGIVNGRTRAENNNDAFIERQTGNVMDIRVSGNEKFASEEVNEYSLRLRASVSYCTLKQKTCTCTHMYLHFLLYLVLHV